MIYKIIVATDSNNGIGKNNTIPWYYPEDLKYFASKTKGYGNESNAIVMGRKTHESIGKVLSGRYNYVLSKTLNRETETMDIEEENIHIFNDIESLKKDIQMRDFDNVWIIGGTEIYKLFLNETDLIQEIYETKISKDYKCDVFFPKVNESQFIKLLTISGNSDDINYNMYVRK